MSDHATPETGEDREALWTKINRRTPDDFWDVAVWRHDDWVPGTLDVADRKRIGLHILALAEEFARVKTETGEPVSSPLDRVDVQSKIRRRLHEIRGHGLVSPDSCGVCDQDSDQLARAVFGEDEADDVAEGTTDSLPPCPLRGCVEHRQHGHGTDLRYGPSRLSAARRSPDEPYENKGGMSMHCDPTDGKRI